ncbi:MAG TPA: hypothetical protein VFB27_14345 [Opitutaceae bacterium]|nr:hypothetical protein [Opitutaceae bacterium]
MGLLLLTVAAQNQGTDSHALFGIAVPPAGLDVIIKIEDFQRSSHRWPKKEEVLLPTEVKELVLTPGNEGLDTVLKSNTTVLLHCMIKTDGTVVIAPPFEQLAEPLMESLIKNSSTHAPFFAPQIVPAKK